MAKRNIFISAAVFTMLSVIFAMFDLKISEALYSPNLIWVRLYQKYAQIPGMLTGFMGASLMLRICRAGKDKKRTTLKIILFLCAFILMVAICIDVEGQKYAGLLQVVAAMAAALLVLAGVQAWLDRYPNELLMKFMPVAKLAVLLVIFAGFITVWAVKIPWGRWTFSSLVKAGDLALYTPWYLPQGITGHYSFISGHTSMAFCVLPLVLLFEKRRLQYLAAWILALLWGFSTGLSRIVIGAHFASDVLFAAGQTLLWFFVLVLSYRKERLNYGEKLLSKSS